MTPIRVWAPHARRVELRLLDAGRDVPMPAEQPGVFELPAEAAQGRYLLVVDGDAIPDPWATEMDDVLGPCRRVDPSAFTWTDRGFRARPLDRAILYELHVGTFTDEGSFDGAIRRLPYLAALGVTHIELMPLATFSGRRGWGYDGAALFAPHAAYGGPAGLQRFVDAAHRHGLAVILDVVYNHLGPIGNFLGRLGPFFKQDGPSTPWGWAVNFDGPNSDEVRRFFLDNAVYWLRDYHIDGLRLDAVQTIHDESALPFLEELSSVVERLSATLDKPLTLIAESDLNDPRLIRERAANGFGLDAQWSDDFHHALHAALTGERHGYYVDFADEPLECLRRTLVGGWLFDGRYSLFRSRRHGRPLGLPRSRLIGYTQNHDQIGNRALGDRLSQRLSPARLKLAATLLLTGPFVPMLFMGEEWGASTPFQYFTDHGDEALGRAVREGRRREHGHEVDDPEMVPDPQDPATFLRSRLRWEERERAPHQELLDYHRRLIALRKAEPALRAPLIEPDQVQADEAAGTLVVERGRFVVACNFAREPASLRLPAPVRSVLGSGGEQIDGVQLRLASEGVAVLERSRS